MTVDEVGMLVAHLDLAREQEKCLRERQGQQAWLKFTKIVKAPAGTGTLVLLPTVHWLEQVTWRSSIPMN